MIQLTRKEICYAMVFTLMVGITSMYIDQMYQVEREKTIEAKYKVMAEQIRVRRDTISNSVNIENLPHTENKIKYYLSFNNLMNSTKEIIISYDPKDNAYSSPQDIKLDNGGISIPNSDSLDQNINMTIKVYGINSIEGKESSRCIFNIGNLEIK